MNETTSPRVAPAIIGCIVILALVAIAVSIGWWALTKLPELVKGISQAQAAVLAAILSGSFTILASVGGSLLSKYWEKKREHERDVRGRKVEVYDDFIKLQFDLIRGRVDEEQALQSFDSLTRRLMIWGSDEVVQSWSDLRSRMTTTGSLSNQAVAVETARLLRLIREDVGHPATTLESRSIARLYLNDADKAFDDVESPGGESRTDSDSSLSSADSTKPE